MCLHNCDMCAERHSRSVRLLGRYLYSRHRKRKTTNAIGKKRDAVRDVDLKFEKTLGSRGLNWLGKE